MKNAGFTLMEVLIVILIIGIITQIALPMYQNELAKAEATNIISIYEEAKTFVAAELEVEPLSCAEINLIKQRHPFKHDHFLYMFYDHEWSASNPDIRGLALGVLATTSQNGQESVEAVRAMKEIMEAHAPEAIPEKDVNLDAPTVASFHMWVSDKTFSGPKCR